MQCIRAHEETLHLVSTLFSSARAVIGRQIAAGASGGVLPNRSRAVQGKEPVVP